MSRYLQLRGVLLLISLTLISVVSADDFNGTTYCLTSDQMVVTQPVNASAINLTLTEKAINMSLFDLEGKSVGLEQSYAFWRGNYNYRIIFYKHVSGKLVYTLPHQGQKLALSIEEKKQVRVILPPGYTTGDRLFGIALPNPDSKKTDNGVTELTWSNVSHDEIIEVGYYKSYAPEMVRNTFIIIAIAALILFAQYYASIRRLRSVRNESEMNFKH